MWAPGPEQCDHSEPEPDSNHQLLFHISAGAENSDEEGSPHVDSGPTGDSEPMPQQRRHSHKTDLVSLYLVLLGQVIRGHVMVTGSSEPQEAEQQEQCLKMGIFLQTSDP
ncbi:hypothetical protein INR49_010456, partial [Caranx melampygus]